MIATSSQNKYLILGDQLYDDDENVDLFQELKNNILNKKVTDIFNNQTFNGKIVSCPQFSKSKQVEIS